MRNLFAVTLTFAGILSSLCAHASNSKLNMLCAQELKGGKLGYMVQVVSDNGTEKALISYGDNLNILELHSTVVSVGSALFTSNDARTSGLEILTISYDASNKYVTGQQAVLSGTFQDAKTQKIVDLGKINLVCGRF